MTEGGSGSPPLTVVAPPCPAPRPDAGTPEPLHAEHCEGDIRPAFEAAEALGVGLRVTSCAKGVAGDSEGLALSEPTSPADVGSAAPLLVCVRVRVAGAGVGVRLGLADARAIGVVEASLGGARVADALARTPLDVALGVCVKTMLAVRDALAEDVPRLGERVALRVAVEEPVGV